MTTRILYDVKQTLGILPDNLGFDLELLIFINSVKVFLVQQGITQLEIDIDETTVWPDFDSLQIGAMVKHYIQAKTKMAFDPTASETISRSLDSLSVELEGRIAHEVEEVAANA